MDLPSLVEGFARNERWRGWETASCLEQAGAPLPVVLAATPGITVRWTGEEWACAMERESGATVLWSGCGDELMGAIVERAREQYRFYRAATRAGISARALEPPDPGNQPSDRSAGGLRTARKPVALARSRRPHYWTSPAPCSPEPAVSLKVGMIGPSLEYVGGISAVVKTWLSSPALAEVEVDYFPSVGVGERRDKLKQTAAAQARFVKRLAGGWRPDVFHVHCGGVMSVTRKLSYLAEIRAARVPVVLHVHGSIHIEELYSRSPVHAKGVRALLRQADRVVVVSRYMEELVRRWMGPDFPVTRVYNPVPTRDYDPIPGFQRDPRPTVLFMGWIIEAKGIFDLLAVAPRLAAACPEVLVRFGGDGVHMDRFRAAAAQCPTPDNIEVAGWVTGRDKLEAYAGADVFCLPSYSEGLPISVLEAMSARLPVVATDISGIPEQVLHGETGLLYRPRDQDALAEHLISLITDLDRARAMGAAGRARVEQVFDREVVAGQVVEAWRSVLR